MLNNILNLSSTIAKNQLLIGFFLLFFWGYPPKAQAQLASPVVDVPCNLIGVIAKSVATASNFLKEAILPLKGAISTMQSFLKSTHEIANGVIINLRMCQQLILLEQKISDLSVQAYQAIDNAQDIPQKWKHKWIIANLYYEGRAIFELFDISVQTTNANGQTSIMDDQQRILLIKESLAKARNIYAAMRLSLRRTQRLEFKIRQQKRQIQKYQEFFEQL